MAREVILYVGLHKTGSSSIQLTCGVNHARLRRAGLAYPTWTGGDGRHLVNFTQVMRNLFRRDPSRIGLAGEIAALGVPLTDSQKQALMAQFASTLHAAEGRAIVVAEGLSTYSPEELSAVRDWFLSLGPSVRVICHVRHIASWLNSMVAQRVRGQFRLTIAEAVDELVRAGGIVRPRIETVRSVFPQAEFYSHEQAAAHPHGPPGFFFQTIGLEDSRGIRWQRANEGGSDLAIRTLSRTNERFGRMRWKGTGEALKSFMAQPGMAAINALGGPKFALLEAEAAPLATLIAQENAWLRDTLGPEFFDPEPAFANQPRDVSAEDRAALAEAIRACDPELRAWLSS